MLATICGYALCAAGGGIVGYITAQPYREEPKHLILGIIAIACLIVGCGGLLV